MRYLQFVQQYLFVQKILWVPLLLLCVGLFSAKTYAQNPGSQPQLFTKPFLIVAEGNSLTDSTLFASDNEVLNMSTPDFLKPFMSLSLPGTTGFPIGQASVARIGDLDGDQVDEFMAANTDVLTTGTINVYSGRTGAVLYSFPNAVANILPPLGRIEDISGDNVDEFFIGQLFLTGPNQGTGFLAIISGSTGSPLQIYQSEPGKANDDFGRAADSLGLIDGDDVPDILISAPNFASTNDPFITRGKVYVYSGVDQSLLYTIDGEIEDFGIAGSQFGRSLAAIGDVDGDGKCDFAVGDIGFRLPNDAQFQRGKAYVYSGATGTEIYSIEGENPEDNFGSQVSGVGDVDGDGINDFLVSARGFPAGNGRGKVYAYSGATGNLIFSLSANPSDFFFGAQLAGTGDLDRDGFADFVVGAPPGSLAAPGQSGTVYIYGGPSGKLIDSFTGTGSTYGSSLSSRWR